MNEQHYWLGFHRIPDMGGVQMHFLHQHFGTLQAAWHAPERELRRANLNKKALDALLKQRNTLDLADEMAKVERMGARFVTWLDDDYPPLLRKIPDAPPVLYVRGSLLPQDGLALGVVGTRRATRYGHDAARHIARELARHQVTIVSGLAQGIDAAAHQGALDGDGRTLAVLGNGIDITYPREHARLAEAILNNGALITEFAPGTPPIGTNFPRRNRIISGLTLGVLVVEAPQGSGALITAEMALEQGRDVFAVPANIFNPAGRGVNLLIQDGAKLITEADDILNELNITHERRATSEQTEQIAPENDAERAILDHLDDEPILVDDIIRTSGLPADQVAATLTILELKGLALKCAPMQYCRAR